MDAAMVKAGLAAAVALTLFVPTFNALNDSYVQNVPPPPWLPTPPTPPDITPPTDMTPPTNFEPPPDYKGKLPPGAQCPPPVVRGVEGGNRTFTMEPGPSFRQIVQFRIPNGALGFGLYANYTNWQAGSITTALQDPDGVTKSENVTGGDALLAQSRSRDTSHYYDTLEDQQPPKPGNYTLRLEAQFPVQGQVKTTIGVILACGGLAS